MLVKSIPLLPTYNNMYGQQNMNSTVTSDAEFEMVRKTINMMPSLKNKKPYEGYQ